MRHQYYDSVEERNFKIPEGRFAGAVLITDGQIHDINEKAEEYAFDALIMR